MVCGSSRWLYTPAVRPSCGYQPDERQLSLSRGRHHFFPRRSFSAALSSMASASSRFSVLVLQRPQPLGLRDVHPSEFSFPFVDAGIADTMLAAKIATPGFVLFQIPDDLLSRKHFALRALVLVLGQSELQTGLSPRGKVRAANRLALAFRAPTARPHQQFISELGAPRNPYLTGGATFLPTSSTMLTNLACPSLGSRKLRCAATVEFPRGAGRDDCCRPG
jgi:hypothetical protein